MKKFLIGIIAGILLSVSVVALAVATGHFPDVSSSAYYADAVNEMKARGVISGYANGNFGPNDPVTRGQLVAILSRYNASLSGYYGNESYNPVGILIDIVCAKVNVSVNDPLIDDFTLLCKDRGEGRGN